MKFRHKAALVAMAALQWLTGCGGGIEGSGSAKPGVMRLAITDAPACGYDAVHLTIEKVRVHQSSGALDADAGWSEVVLTPAKRVDLLTLTNGVLEQLGQTSLPAGKYTQMRLVLASNGNSVTPAGGAETVLTTPSGQQSGIKLNVNLDVAADQVADFAIDFDACKSIVKRGNSGQYNLKPVVSVIPILGDAGLRVVGFVDMPMATLSTSVSVQLNGVPVKATVPDATGRFVLYPVPAGTYDLVITAPGRVSAVVTGVPVTSTAFTNVNSNALPISPANATMRTVTGTVTPAAATLRALQSLSGGPTIELSWGPVDADTGAFALALPIEAPVRAAYVASPQLLVFTADMAVGGKYTLEADTGSATKTQIIDATAAVPPVTFTFP